MIFVCDYVYDMNDVGYTLFQVIHFPNNGRIVVIDELAFIDPPHYSTLDKAFPLFVPSVLVNTANILIKYVDIQTLKLLLINHSMCEYHKTNQPHKSFNHKRRDIT